MRPTLHSGRREQITRVFGSPLALCSRVRSIDSASCRGRIATTKRRLVPQHHAANVSQHGVVYRRIGPITANNDGLVTFRPLSPFLHQQISREK